MSGYLELRDKAMHTICNHKHAPKKDPMTISIRKSRVLLFIVSLYAAFSLISPPLLAAIIQGYQSDDTGLQPGMAVALSDTSTADKPKVERASQDKDDQVIGVASIPEDNLVTIASGEQSVFVQTSGEVDAYVTDLNGDIKQGDLLSVSPLRGILMDAGDNVATIVGTALTDLSSITTETRQIETSDGTKEVKIGKLKVNLDHKAASNQQTSGVDSSLSRLGESIVGKQVGELRVVIAMLIFFLVLVSEGGIIYGAISSAITAVGRNPLARNIIKGELIRVIAIAFFVLIIGLGAIYGILWV